MMEQVKKEFNRSPKKVTVPDLNHSHTIDQTRNPNFIRDLDESHHQLDLSSFNETSNRRDPNSQSDLLSRRIDLEVSPSPRKEGTKLTRPKRLERNIQSNRDNSHQHSDCARVKVTIKPKIPRKIIIA